MKYNEHEKKVKKIGCFYTGEELAGHPMWINPKTGVRFPMSHLRAAGLK